MASPKKKGGKKGRKIGRNAEKCKAYRAAGRREKNKKRRLAKHLRNHPQDLAAAASYDEKTRGESIKGICT